MEPDSSNFEQLNYNVSKNNINSSCLNAGIWSKSGKLNLVKDFRDKNDRSIRVEDSETGTIRAISMMDLIKKYHVKNIDILKIDIEGAEKEIFDKEKSDLSFLNITKCLAIEIHDEFDCRKDIEDVLYEYNFELLKSGELTIGINTLLR